MLRSGSGETVLQIIIIGDIELGEEAGYVDILASCGHMRWLQKGTDTLPTANRDWLQHLEDFVTIFPHIDADQIMDDNRDQSTLTPWVNCRQCRGKEKTPLATSEFYHAAKHTSKWSEAIILENTHTGGYPIPDPYIDDPINVTFPISKIEWRGTTENHQCVENFFTSCTEQFSTENVIRSANRGDKILERYGGLKLALRAVQEPKMVEQAHIVENARIHLAHDSAMCEDITTLRRIGAMPRYRGKEPGTFRVRGLPHNPLEQDFIMSKLWSYVQAGKMFVCNSSAIHGHSQYMVSPSTTVAKKLPRPAHFYCPQSDT